MHKSLLIATLMCLLVGNSACSSGDNKFGQSALFHDERAQTQFVAALEKEGIPYRVDDKNVVWYAASAESKIKRIRDDVIATSYPGPNSISIAREGERKLFIQALNQEKIAYEERTVSYKEGETTYITWNPEDNGRVHTILKRVRTEFNRSRGAR